jgi:hypothetical protein
MTHYLPAGRASCPHSNTVPTRRPAGCGVLAGRGDPEPRRKHVPPRLLLDMMLRIRARALTSIAFPVQVGARKLARVPMRRR